MRTLLAVLALAAAAPAVAADLPEATGMAQRGSLKVVSRVLLSPTGGEMKGVWLDGKATCLTKRTLRVSIQIDLVSAAGKTTRITRARTGTVDNCAEGGPNFGFDLKPRAYRMALRERPLEARALLAVGQDDARALGADRPGEPVPPDHPALLTS